MSYYSEMFTWDCTHMGDQFPTGLDVQLPGHDLLLPFQDGYLAKPATILGPTTKCLPDESHLLEDLLFDDTLNSLDSHVPDSDDQLNILDESSFNQGEYLPSSPETDCLDLSEIDFSQPAFIQDPVVVPEVLGSDGAHIEALSGTRGDESVQGGLFDDGSHLFDVDPTWLLNTLPILPSLEDIESFLLASPESVAEPSSAKPPGEDTWIEGFCVEETLPGNYVVATVVQNPVFISQPIIEQADQSPVMWLNNPVLNVGSQLPCFASSKACEDEMIMSSSLYNASCSPSPSDDSGYDSSNVGPAVSSGQYQSGRYEPYSAKPERRERKREQNKTAALKYRQKKRTEQGHCMSEFEQLEKRNGELKSRMEELTREIKYLKGLISEIYSCQAE